MDVEERINWKYVSLALAVLLVASGAYVFLGNGQAPTGDSNAHGTVNNTVDGYATANESTGSPADNNVVPDGTVEIQKYGVSPSRVETKIGGVVQWENTNDFSVRLEFDRTPQEPVIAPGETFQMSFKGITYYDVYNVKTGDNYASGSIYVE